MMRKKIAIMILCVLASLSVGHAQEENTFKHELSIGGSLGMNLTTVSFSPRVPTSLKSGINGGVTLRWITEPHLGLQAEINFTQNGWKEKFEEQPQYKYSRTINYIEIPFLTHIYFGREVRFFINLGPRIGYAISESTDSNLNGTNPNSNRPDDQHETEIQKKFDWGIGGGPGIEIRTGIGSFLVEGRYFYSLGDLYNSRKSDTFAKSSSQVIAVKLTYLIPIHSK